MRDIRRRDSRRGVRRRISGFVVQTFSLHSQVENLRYNGQKLADNSSIHSILNRPISERIREHKYRFAQCLIFGLPVLALHFFGAKLGGPEAGRWTGLLAALLAGWCLYVGAVPLLSEGMMLLAQRQFKMQLLIGCGAMAFYIVGVVGWIMALRGGPAPFAAAFAYAVVLLVVWSGVNWLLLRNRTETG